MKPIIEVNRLSKSFQVQSSKGSSYKTFRDIFNFQRAVEQKDTFWALKDISFTLNEGETLGIIGRNGAGKSTLLKVISNIMKPTSGEVVLRGRVASLLEVGTGFHPELTGRENIFLNGSILGLKRQEIIQNFDAIIDFSGVEQFINTPLKHYSSGMRLRLAFSVAAFLNPEILLIDEVLAVGDTQFQEKCIAKMNEVSKSGRTIIFVSHDASSIKKLCKNGLLLENGTVKKEGSIHQVLDYYTKSLKNNISNLSTSLPKQSNKLEVVWVKLLSQKELKVGSLKLGEPFSFQINVKVLQNIECFVVLGLKTQEGLRLATDKSISVTDKYSLNKNTEVVIEANYSSLTLLPGIYHLFLSLREFEGAIICKYDEVITFEVSEVPFQNVYPFHKEWGSIRANPSWRIIS